MMMVFIGAAAFLVTVLLVYAIQKHKNMAKNYKIGKAGEDKVYEILKKTVPPKSILLSNLYLTSKDKITEVDLVLVTIKGVFVFEIKNYAGSIYGNEKLQNWTKIMNSGKITTFYNPVWQNEGHIRMLKRLLPEVEARYFYSYIVFGGSCQLKKMKVKRKHARVLKAEELRSVFRRNMRFRFRVFRRNQIQAIAEKLECYQKSSFKIKYEHKKQIKIIKSNKK